MKFDIKNLVIDYEKTLEGSKFLVKKASTYDGYKEGVKTGPEGLVYTCMCESLNYDKVSIKIPGVLTPIVDYEGKPIPVEFDNLSGKVWKDYTTNEINISLVASAIHLAGDSKRIKLEGGK